jgi:hypothetical protein
MWAPHDHLQVSTSIRHTGSHTAMLSTSADQCDRLLPFFITLTQALSHFVRLDDAVLMITSVHSTKMSTPLGDYAPGCIASSSSPLE